MAADLAVTSAAAAAATEVEQKEASPKVFRQNGPSQLPRYQKGSGLRVNGGQSVTLTFHGTDSAHNPTSHPSSNGNDEGVDAEESVVDPLNCSVYLDQLHGKWKYHHCNWTYFVGSLHSGALGNHRKWKCSHCNSNSSNQTWLGKHGAPNFSSEIQGAESINGTAEKNGVLSNGLKHQYGAIAYDGKLSASTETPSLSLVEKEKWNQGSIVGGLNSMEETRKGVTDSDVETVLEKQDTHDLYCPDCSSRITRRVVLNRRKQYTPNGHAMLEETQPEMAFHPRVDAESNYPANVQGHNIEISPDNGNSPACNSSSEECGAGAFRCLSCFRFFIPKGRVRSHPQHGSQTSVAEQNGRGREEGYYRWEILKSVVFGGLIESITSLGVVSSAAGSGAATLNVLLIGLANLISGLIIISYNASFPPFFDFVLLDLKDDYSKASTCDNNDDEAEDRYQKILGRR